MKEHKIILPPSFTKKYHNAKLIQILNDEINWGMRPLAYDAKGRRKLIQINSLLFEYIERNADYDFFLDPYDDELFELVPPNLCRQGIGFSVDQELNGLQLDMHFVPCNYSDDGHRKLPMEPLHIPVVTIFDHDVIDWLIKRYFPVSRQSAAIPFSAYRVAELEGFFMDDYAYTEKICHQAVKGATAEEIENCERFLAFVKNAGFHH